MIAYLSGSIKHLSEKFIILNTGSVGYKVFVTPKTIQLLKKKKYSEKIEFFTHLQIRDDAHELYGFLTYEELEFFGLVTSVQGVGPKVGLHIMSEASVLEIKKALVRSDVEFFDKVPGIGRKKAKKFVIELQDKIDILPEKEFSGGSNFDDAVAALMHLGYKSGEAREALRQVPADVSDMGKKIRYALKLLSK